MFRIAAIGAATCLALGASAQTVPLSHLERVDSDGDGAVSRGEFDTFAARAFQMLDTNSDQSLSQAEFEGQVEGASFSDLDENGDGMVARQEFGRRMTANFNAADRDGNGVID